MNKRDSLKKHMKQKCKRIKPNKLSYFIKR